MTKAVYDPNNDSIIEHSALADAAPWTGVTGKPTFGTASAKDIPPSGDASTGQVVYGTDTRLTNARTPSAHASSHIPGGGDVIAAATATVAGLVPTPPNDATKFFRGDATFAALATGGTSRFYDSDDFLQAIATSPSDRKFVHVDNSAGAAAQSANINVSTSGHHGLISLRPGTAINQYARIFSTPIYLAAGSSISCRSILYPLDWVAAETIQIYFGFASTPGPLLGTSDYSAIFYLQPSGSNNWQALVRTLAAATTQDSGVAGTAGNWVTLRIVATSTSIAFYVNNVLTNTITTNIPPTTQLLYPFISINSSTNTANRTLYVDTAEIDIDSGIANKFLKTSV